MKWWCLAPVLLLLRFPAAGQDGRVERPERGDFAFSPARLAADSLALLELPSFQVPEWLKRSGLPYRVDNSRSIYFPPIFEQYGWSCNQSSSIAYIFTYELNASRIQIAGKPENRMSLFFPWNMLNSGKADVGASYFDSWALVGAAGCATELDFGFGTGQGSDDHTRWMTGYSKYYRAMQNRIDGLAYIDIGTEDGLLTLKRWLYDHGGGYEPGGLANFQIASGGVKFTTLSAGTEEEGKAMISTFGTEVGHAMTFVGYNDSVRYDFNNDGRYTNNIDINGDNKVTMLDWEIGALICVNTYGRSWGSEGRAFVPYSLLPKYHTSGGIWMRSAVITRVSKNYKPKVTLKTRFTYTNRSKLWITAGVSQNPSADDPDHILDLPVFHYQGGGYPMLGVGTGDRSKIEIGIDATPLLSHIAPGEPAAFFLVVNERDPASSDSGQIEFFSFIDYTKGSEEFYGDAYYAPIDKEQQVFKVVITPNHNPPVVSTSSLPGAAAGQFYSAQLSAQGGTPPYTWMPLGQTYAEESFIADFPMITETRVLPVIGNNEKATVSLPFEFPYAGKGFNKMTLYASGAIIFETSNYSYPYVIDQKKLLALNLALYPFYSREVQLPHFEDWIYYLADDSSATIRWNASVTVNSKNSDVNFAARIYPSGVVEYYYGTFQDRPGFSWLSGLAGGSEQNFLLSDVYFRGVQSGLNLRYTPVPVPEGMSLSAEGLLSGTPAEAGRTWEIPVCVEDHSGLRGTRKLLFTTGAAVIIGESSVSSVILYPNPVKDRCWLVIKSPVEGDVVMRVYDIAGREVSGVGYRVSGIRFRVLEGVNRILFDGVGQLEGGVYLYRVSGVVEGRGKFVK